MSKKNLKDHRQIGQELELFLVHEYSPGAIFWLPKGWIIYQELANFIRQQMREEGYQEISTPILVKNKIFKRSGHFDLFFHNMFNLPIYEEQEINEHLKLISQGKIPDDIEVHQIGDKKIYYPKPNFSLKPMNCPESTVVYSSRIRSYNELPIKLSDFGILHRRELSGVVGGLFRLRQFTIDDAHIYVRPDQIQDEIHKLIVLVKEVYNSFNFIPFFFLSTKPDKAMGNPELWKKAEQGLERALKDSRLKYEIKPKEGTFYGPKIDIQIKDSQDRDWQLATIQLDFQIPDKMELEYIDKDGKPKRPVIIHRAIFGSFERFVGILIEHYQGAFPVWLSPVQAVVIPITDKNNEYAQQVGQGLIDEGIRVEVDKRSETMQAKIRDAQTQKVPYMLIVGEREEKANQVSVRTRGGEDLGGFKLADFIEKIKKEVERKN